MIEVKKPEAVAIEYPVARKCKDSGAVVIFWGKEHATVVLPGKSQLNAGLTYNETSSCTDKNGWEPVDLKIYG